MKDVGILQATAASDCRTSKARNNRSRGQAVSQTAHAKVGRWPRGTERPRSGADPWERHQHIRAPARAARGHHPKENVAGRAKRNRGSSSGAVDVTRAPRTPRSERVEVDQGGEQRGSA
jgi:hypothetical protein